MAEQRTEPQDREPTAPVPDPGTRLMSLLGPVRGQLLLALALGALGGVAAVVGLILVGLAAGEVLSSGPDRSRVAWLLGGALVAAVARFALRKIAFDVSHLASFELETYLRRDLSEQLARIPLGEVQRLGSGALKKVVQDDVRALHGAVADSVPLIGGGLAQPVAALIALAIVDWRMLLAVLSIVPVVVIGFRMVTKDYAVQRRAYDEANEAVNEAVVEFVQGMPVVRTFDDGTTSFARFARAVADFTRATDNWQREGYSAGVLTRAAMTPLPTLVIVCAVGTWLVTADLMSPTALVIAVLIGTMPVESIVPLMYLSDYINQSKAGAARIGEIHDLAPLPRPAEPREPADGSIRFRDVVFSYGAARSATTNPRDAGPTGADRLALDAVRFEIPAGSVCALVGASGSGKSTIARLIPRFWDVQQGSVEIGGVDVREIAPEELLRRVSLVFQETFLLDDTVAANIRMARPEATDAEVETAARAAQADTFIRCELPQGYQTRVGERGGLLSGGQRQRLTIARALLADAPIVVLDEATAYADPQNEAAIQDAIAELTVGRTVVVIAHRLSTIVDADQILVLDAGRVIERGTHVELLAGDGRYAAMWRDHERARDWGMAHETSSEAADLTAEVTR